MTEAEATRQVRDLAEQIREAAGAPALVNDSESSAPCETHTDDESGHVRYVQGAYNLRVPSSQHVTAFHNVRDQWQRTGWTISDYRVADDTGDGTMSVKAPVQSFTFTLTTAKTPDTFALIVQSGCYRTSPASIRSGPTPGL